MSFILDSSITLSWCFSDEATPLTNSLLTKVEKDKAYVPNLWPLEVSNVLVMAERKKRINYAQIIEFIALLNDLNIEIDHHTSNIAFHEILSLAHSERLTTYDAAYLELAMRMGLPLATKDKQLQDIASRSGVVILS